MSYKSYRNHEQQSQSALNYKNIYHKIKNLRFVWLAPLDMLVMSILLIGLLSVASTTIIDHPQSFNLSLFTYGSATLFLKQCLVGLVGLLLYFSIPHFLSMQIIAKYRFHLFLFAFLLSCLVHINGIGIGVGASGYEKYRWIAIYQYQLQPSEIARIAMILFLAFYLERHQKEVLADSFIAPFKTFMISVVVLLPIISEDLSTSIVFMMIALVMLTIAGCRFKVLVLLALICVSVVALFIYFNDFRMNRLDFLFPWQDSIGKGYQLLQALSAQELGGLFGKGYALSVQRLQVLPEAHNDFILSIMMEDWGLIPILIVVFVFYGSLIFYILEIAKASYKNQQFSSSYFCYGIATWLFIQVFFNLAVNLGLAPPTGLNLPLVSYGGSSLLFTLISLGLVKMIAQKNINQNSQNWQNKRAFAR